MWIIGAIISILIIGYLIYFVVIVGMKHLLELPTLNALCLFSLVLSFVFHIISIIVHGSSKQNKATEDTLDMIAIVFFALSTILGIYYLFK